MSREFEFPANYRSSHNNFIFGQELQADLPIKSKVNYAALCRLIREGIYNISTGA